MKSQFCIMEHRTAPTCPFCDAIALAEYHAYLRGYQDAKENLKVKR